MDIIGELNKANGKFLLTYWLIVIAAINLIGFLIGWKYVWIIGIAAGILSTPIGKRIQKKKYASLVEKIRTQSE